MSAILFEGTLFVALILVIGALVIYAVRHYSGVGVRSQQNQNRRTLLDDAGRTCPTHGLQPAESLVRLENGTLVCSHCFQRLLNDDTVHQ